MSNILIGRNEEKQILTKLLNTNGAEMLAIIGRRRVGKTFLIREALKKDICFEMTGTKDALKEEQLQKFSDQLKLHTKSFFDLTIPRTWAEAFKLLTGYLETIKSKKKPVLFFDELPWLATHRSGFLEALGYFWNSYASRKKIFVIICGSAASWMLDNIVNHKGGLHNRITKIIELEPFNLFETEKYLKSRKVNLDRYQIIQLYMVTGGIPHYLKEIEPGLSAAQNIELICFSKNGILKNEFNNLYPALFAKSKNHIAIIKALSSKRAGLTRNEIISITKLPDGGSSSKHLDELTKSGFITNYLPFGKLKKDTLFRLTDEYSFFYLKFIENKRNQNWLAINQQPTWKSWSGYAFENVCMKHAQQIKKALGISGIKTEESSFYKKGDIDSLGFQIDMLIDRQDGNINLCEMKYYNSEFMFDGIYAKKARDKIESFKRYSKTKKNIFFTMVSTFGVKPNKHSIGLVDNDITIDELFKQ